MVQAVLPYKVRSVHFCFRRFDLYLNTRKMFSQQRITRQEKTFLALLNQNLLRLENNPSILSAFDVRYTANFKSFVYTTDYPVSNWQIAGNC